MKTDTIGGFPLADPRCKGCGKPLHLTNAWMTDGCPCNSPLGINSMNETRWRLLMQLQQEQSRKLETIGNQNWIGNAAEECSNSVLVGAGKETFEYVITKHFNRVTL